MEFSAPNSRAGRGGTRFPLSLGTEKGEKKRYHPWGEGVPPIQHCGFLSLERGKGKEAKIIFRKRGEGWRNLHGRRRGRKKKKGPFRHSFRIKRKGGTANIGFSNRIKKKGGKSRHLAATGRKKEDNEPPRVRAQKRKKKREEKEYYLLRVRGGGRRRFAVFSYRKGKEPAPISREGERSGIHRNHCPARFRRKKRE